MSKSISIDDLDKFLDNKGETTVQVAEQATPTQNPLSMINQGVQQGNSTISDLNSLVQGINDLIKNAGDLFMRNIERKEARIQGGNYEDYVKQAQQKQTPGENPAPAPEVSYNEAAARVYKWMEFTLGSIPGDTTAEQIVTNWTENETQFVEMIAKIIRGDAKFNSQSSAPSAPKKRKSKGKKSKPGSNGTTQEDTVLKEASTTSRSNNDQPKES